MNHLIHLFEDEGTKDEGTDKGTEEDEGMEEGTKDEGTTPPDDIFNIMQAVDMLSKEPTGLSYRTALSTGN